MISFSDVLNKSKLYNRLENEEQLLIKQISEKIFPFYDRIVQIFPEFTPHGVSHVFEVNNNIEKLLGEVLDDLNIDQIVRGDLG